MTASKSLTGTAASRLAADHAAAGPAARPPDPADDHRPPLQMWGGLECTVARIGTEVVDQTRLNGHHDRPDDLERFAALGIAAIRYPVLWERVEPNDTGQADWRWTDQRLGRMRELGLRPIATLLHHGNGPRDTELADAAFVKKFVGFATRVAERYPWLVDYTPINEPLTTARFCGLYGLWHPHARDHRTFVRILINQIMGIRLAMRAIREVNPRARLVQTEDLAKAHSTPSLAYQARYENARRWLTFDLLTGRVTDRHPLWSYLTRAGVGRELDELAADPCPPDLVGLDYYPPSERFLDDRVERYPAGAQVGNGRDRYVDLDAVRVLRKGLTGFERLAFAAWRRYGLPLAATEVHLGCTREEQLRWLKETWDAALRLRARGVDVRAVTAWALLGSYDWDSLLTARRGRYEPGAFDVRGQEPRPTAVARMVRDLATTGEARHPVLETPGWWRRDDRLLWPPPDGSCIDPRPARRGRPRARPLLVAGAGRLADAIVGSCAARGLLHHAPSGTEFDISNPRALAAIFGRVRPWAVVHAGFARGEDAEMECRRDDVLAASGLAQACAAAGIQLLAWPAHLNLEGDRHEPCLEGDAPAPGRRHAMNNSTSERVVLGACPQALLVRAGPLRAPWDQPDSALRGLHAVRAGTQFEAAGDLTISPAYLPHLVDLALDLLIDQECGVWHLTSCGAIRHVNRARAIPRGAGPPADRVRSTPAGQLAWPPLRPAAASSAPAGGF